jgi:hypothetical protein
MGRFTITVIVAHSSIPGSDKPSGSLHVFYCMIRVQLAPHESITGGLAMFLIFSFPIWAAFVAFVQHYTLANSRRLAWFFISWIVVLILSAIDPGYFIRWFFD